MKLIYHKKSNRILIQYDLFYRMTIPDLPEHRQEIIEVKVLHTCRHVNIVPVNDESFNVKRLRVLHGMPCIECREGR